MKKYIIPVSESIDLKLEGNIATISQATDEYFEDNTGWHSEKKADGPWSSELWAEMETEE